MKNLTEIGCCGAYCGTCLGLLKVGLDHTCGNGYEAFLEAAASWKRAYGRLPGPQLPPG